MNLNSILKSLLAGGLTGCLLVVACETKSKLDSAEKANEENEVRFDTTAEKNAEFVVEAVVINLKEIKCAELATKKAVASDVKAFAEMMIEHHKIMYKEVVAFANKRHISIPDSVAIEDIPGYQTLSEQKGKDFDRKFIDAMVDGHKKVIDKFEEATTSYKYDTEVKSLAANALPTIRSHYDKAKALQAKYEEKKM